VSSVRAETRKGNVRCAAIVVKTCLSSSPRVNEEDFI
jgi:hypothetical protein